MILERLFEVRADTVSVNDWNKVYSSENGYDSPLGTSMKESTYFSCLKIISESIAKCNLEVRRENEKGEKVDKTHSLYDLLRLRPNPYMSASDCYKTVIALMKHYGIAGLLINKQGSKVEGLYPVKLVNCTIDNAGLINSDKNNKILWDWQSVDGETGSALDKDVIVLRDFTLDGIRGHAVRTVVGQSLDTSRKSQDYLNKLFGNGLTNKLIVQLTSDIKEEKEIGKIQDKFNRIYATNGKVFTVPAGYNVTPLNLSLADSQFVDLRKLSKEEIATTLQVPLSKLGILRDTAISEEQDNIKFLSDCLQIIFTQFEQEADYKLLTKTDRDKGYKIRFNIAVMLRVDQKTQSEVITNYVKNGVYDLDHARSIVAVEKLGGAPIITFPSGQVLLEDLRKGNTSYQTKEVGEINADN